MKYLLSLVLLSLLITVCLSSCPNNCNNRGRCSSASVCVCDRFYYGSDCSIWRDVLEVGVPKRGTVERFKWRFYNFTLSPGQGFTLTVEQAGAQMDVDVYIGKNSLPDFSNHFMEETSTDQTFTITLEEPVLETTVFYVGLFGFSAGTSEFTLTLRTTSGGCPSECNGRGTCTRGQCVCNTGYTGTACENSVNSIVIGQLYSGVTVAEGEWVFFSYTLNTISSLNLHVTQVSGDVDIYIRFGQNPTWFEYQYVDTSTNTDINILIDSANLGTWYFGFYGYRSSVFNFGLARTSECSDQCSNHGTCRGNTCVCNQGFTGRSCDTMTTALANDQIVNGYVSRSGWNFYHFSSNSANSFVVELNQTSSSDDCDIYVNKNENPTLSNYLFNEISIDNVVRLRIDDAGTSTWYIGVFGYKRCEYTLRAFESTSCPGGCGTHGTCNPNGRCVCANGWVGANCQTRAGGFVNGNTLTGQTVNPNEWKYFTITVENTSQLNVVVKEQSTQGMVWVFVAAGQYPTLADHDEADTETRTAVHRVTLEWSTPRSGVQYFIGVYGSPFALREVIFDISIYYTPF